VFETRLSDNTMLFYTALWLLHFGSQQKLVMT